MRFFFLAETQSRRVAETQEENWNCFYNNHCRKNPVNPVNPVKKISAPLRLCEKKKGSNAI
jgi:hypothetical protein